MAGNHCNHYSFGVLLMADIIAVQEVVAVKEQKYYLYLSDDEYRQTIQSLVHLKNNLIAQGRCTDGVDDVLCKVLSAKKRKFKIKYF